METKQNWCIPEARNTLMKLGKVSKEVQSRKNFIQTSCISYLLIHDTLPQSSVAEKSKLLLSHSACRSGIQGQPCWWLWLRVSLSCWQEDLLPSSPMWLFTGFSSSRAAGPSASVLLWLLAGNCPQIPTMWHFHKAAHDMTVGFPLS